jgi:hypothetical protein
LGLLAGGAENGGHDGGKKCEFFHRRPLLPVTTDFATSTYGREKNHWISCTVAVIDLPPI